MTGEIISSWDIKSWIAVIGGLAGLVGCISGIFALRDRWANRKPKLTLFAPYNWNAVDSGTRQPVLFFLARISNDSKASAFLYLETMAVEVRSKGQWYKTLRLETDSNTPLETDFPQHEKVRFGVNDVKYLNRFGRNRVTYDEPLTGLVVVAAPCVNDVVVRDLDGIRISVKDCHFKRYVLERDLTEQRRKHDPSYEKPSR